MPRFGGGKDGAQDVADLSPIDGEHGLDILHGVHTFVDRYYASPVVDGEQLRAALWRRWGQRTRLTWEWGELSNTIIYDDDREALAAFNAVVDEHERKIDDGQAHR